MVLLPFPSQAPRHLEEEGWEHEPGMCMPSINVRRTCIKRTPRGCDWPMAPQSKPRGPKWLHVANLGQTSGVRPKPHTRTTLVAWDEPWPHLHTQPWGLGGTYASSPTVGKQRVRVYVGE